MFNEFLPENYQPPKTMGSYLKLQDGENKLRILSKPIIGWEDWEHMRPIRYKMDEKPSEPKTADKPIKHFWAMIVWDYTEQKIKIWHVTQASIIKALGQLVQDSDWGAPFYYDIKVIKTGQEMRTKYSINPSPHKPVSDEIKRAFHDKPIYLEALYTNDDPFAPWKDVTPGHFDRDIPKKTISTAQAKEILEYIGDDKDYMETLLTNIKKHFGCNLLVELPIEKYDAILKSVKLRAQERMKKELETKVNDLPF